MMPLTATNIFDALRKEHERINHFPIVCRAKDPAEITRLCERYKNNYAFVLEMWRQYLIAVDEERWGYSFEYFLKPHRLNKYAKRAYMHFEGEKEDDVPPPQTR